MISFIIPAYNEERLLNGTLDAVHAAARLVGEPYEVVVADDASTDRTAAIAEQGGARVVRVAHRQIAATRNSGARAAQGDFLIFVDADTRINEAVVRGALRAVRQGAVGGGAAVRFDEPVPAYARLLQKLIVGLFRLARFACGCFLFCTRQAFETAGGFNEHLFGAEELALSRALQRQGQVVILRDAVTTSGRKLRAYSAWEIFSLLGRLALGGWKSVQDRRGMDLWYGERREDPEQGRCVGVGGLVMPLTLGWPLGMMDLGKRLTGAHCFVGEAACFAVIVNHFFSKIAQEFRIGHRIGTISLLRQSTIISKG